MKEYTSKHSQAKVWTRPLIRELKVLRRFQVDSERGNLPALVEAPAVGSRSLPILATLSRVIPFRFLPPVSYHHGLMSIFLALLKFLCEISL